MAKCQGPNCKNDAASGPKASKAIAGKFCSDKCRLKKAEAIQLEQDKEKEKKKLEARKAEMEEMARAAKKKQEEADAKKKKIAQLATQWKSEVNSIVKEVKQLRSKHPTINGINAGRNTFNDGDDHVDVTIVGGTSNPLIFKLPSDAKNITRAEVFDEMGGVDVSDSSDIKFRVTDSNGNILVHLR